jgi:hypothetical protein
MNRFAIEKKYNLPNKEIEPSMSIPPKAMDMITL